MAVAGPRAAFLFWHSDSQRLSKRARAAMLGALERPVFVSTVSGFEISTTVRLGKLAVPNDLLNELAYVVESDGSGYSSSMQCPRYALASCRAAT